MEPSLKRFLAKVALFFLPLFAGAYFLDAFLSENLKKSRDGEMGAWNEIYAGNVNSDIVIYGTSRVVGQFDPQIIADGLRMTTYNLGMQGNNFGIQYLRHSVLLEYNSKPKVILQSVEPFTFLKRKDPYDPDQFLPYMLNDPQVTAATAAYRTYTYWDRHIPMLRYYGKIVALATAMKLFLHPSGYPPERNRGYKSSAIAWDGDSERARRYWQGLNLVPDSAVIQLFERYLKECRDLGIKVIFVDPPEYIDARRFVPYREELSAIVKAMSEEYGVPFLNYSENWLTNQPRYFSDAMHLNTNGADLFTKELVADLRPLVTINGVVK